MRFLANENVPGPVVRELRRMGHDVVWVKEDLAGHHEKRGHEKRGGGPPSGDAR